MLILTTSKSSLTKADSMNELEFINQLGQNLGIYSSAIISLNKREYLFKPTNLKYLVKSLVHVLFKTLIFILIISAYMFASYYLFIFLVSLFQYVRYWIFFPFAVGVIVFPSYYFAKSGKTNIVLKNITKEVPNKATFTVFVILLITYLILYLLIPYYVMPFVHNINKNKLKILVSEIVGNVPDEAKKAYLIHKWIFSNINNVYRCFTVDGYIVFSSKPPYICLRLIKHDCPLWVLVTKCGACLEYSLLYRELANAANLTVRSIHNPGEDHSWNEVLVNGRWIIVDPSTGKFNCSPQIFEKGRKLNVSYVYAEYPNGTIVDVTERYTNTGTLVIHVVYADGKPAKNISIDILSLNYHLTGIYIAGLNCITNDEGLCRIKLGGGKYRIIVAEIRYVNSISNIITHTVDLISFTNTSGATKYLKAYYGETTIKLSEGTCKNITIILEECNIFNQNVFHKFLSKNILLVILLKYIVFPLSGFSVLVSFDVLAYATVSVSYTHLTLPTN